MATMPFLMMIDIHGVMIYNHLFVVERILHNIPVFQSFTMGFILDIILAL